MKDLRLRLPDETYARLKAEAEKMRVATTTLTRHALDCWLRERFRKARQDAIAAYAADTARMQLDLDSALESTTIQHLLKTRSLSAPLKVG